jgi:hypothetical protein
VDPLNRIFWTQSYFSGNNLNWIGVTTDTFTLVYNITDVYFSVTADWDPIMLRGIGFGLIFQNETSAKRILYSLDGKANMVNHGFIEPEIYFSDFGGESGFDPESRNLYTYMSYEQTSKTYLLTVDVDTLKVTNSVFDLDCSNVTAGCPYCLGFSIYKIRTSSMDR